MCCSSSSATSEEHTEFSKLLSNLKQCESEGWEGKYAVLLSTGSLNPVHYGHVQMMHQAKSELQNYCRDVRVIGGFLSPSHDGYVQSKFEKGKYLSSEKRAEIIESILSEDGLKLQRELAGKESTVMSDDDDSEHDGRAKSKGSDDSKTDDTTPDDSKKIISSSLDSTITDSSLYSSYKHEMVNVMESVHGWLQCDRWEMSLDYFVDYPSVCDALMKRMKQVSFLSSLMDASRLRLYYVCGMDHASKCGLLDGFLYHRRKVHTLIVVRPGSYGSASFEIGVQKRSVKSSVVIVQSPVDFDRSSTIVRRLIQSKDFDSLERYLPCVLVKDIREHYSEYSFLE